LRIGSVQTRVYKKRGEFATLGHMARAHRTLVTDSVRAQNRIKSLLRSRRNFNHPFASSTPASHHFQDLPRRLPAHVATHSSAI
jgi:hypothetical protein